MFPHCNSILTIAGKGSQAGLLIQLEFITFLILILENIQSYNAIDEETPSIILR